jgi:hypothetical protein
VTSLTTALGSVVRKPKISSARPTFDIYREIQALRDMLLSRLDHPREHIVQVGLILDAEVRGADFFETLLQIESNGRRIFRVGCRPDG